VEERNTAFLTWGVPVKTRRGIADTILKKLKDENVTFGRGSEKGLLSGGPLFTGKAPRRT